VLEDGRVVGVGALADAPWGDVLAAPDSTLELLADQLAARCRGAPGGPLRLQRAAVQARRRPAELSGLEGAGSQPRPAPQQPRPAPPPPPPPPQQQQPAAAAAAAAPQQQPAACQLPLFDEARDADASTRYYARAGMLQEQPAELLEPQLLQVAAGGSGEAKVRAAALLAQLKPHSDPGRAAQAAREAGAPPQPACTPEGIRARLHWQFEWRVGATQQDIDVGLQCGVQLFPLYLGGRRFVARRIEQLAGMSPKEAALIVEEVRTMPRQSFEQLPTDLVVGLNQQKGREELAQQYPATMAAAASMLSMGQTAGSLPSGCRTSVDLRVTAPDSAPSSGKQLQAPSSEGEGLRQAGAVPLSSRHRDGVHSAQHKPGSSNAVLLLQGRTLVTQVVPAHDLRPPAAAAAAAAAASGLCMGQGQGSHPARRAALLLTVEGGGGKDLEFPLLDGWAITAIASGFLVRYHQVGWAAVRGRGQPLRAGPLHPSGCEPARVLVWKGEWPALPPPS
jgi:hypothetical protein